MNDPRPPLTDDELSAHLDGEAAPDVADRIAADPQAAARLQALRAAATAASEPVDPLDPALVDDLVGRAIGAAATDAGPADPGGADAVVAPLVRPRRSTPSLLVAAVVLVLVAAGLGLVWSGTRGDDTVDTASSEATAAERRSDEAAAEPPTDAEAGSDATATDSAGDGAGGASEASPTTVAGAAGTVGGVDLPDLGAFDTPEALRSSLADGFPADAPTGRAATSEGPIEQVGVDRCAGLLREVLPVTDQAPTQVGFARVGSETVLVYEFTAAPDRAASTTTTPGAAPTVLTTAVRPQACDPLFVFQR